MVDIKEFIGSVDTYFKETKSEPHARYRSWEYCYNCFLKARKMRESQELDYDYLALQLGFYLASWGMYRGSSFILKKDYKIHIPAVKMTLEEQYDPLMGIECSSFEKHKGLFEHIYGRLEEHYLTIRKNIEGYENVKKNVSKILISKILLGTLACVPAYDENFTSAVKYYGVTTGECNIDSISGLCKFYEEHNYDLEKARKKLKFEGEKYPQMKMIDMGFFKLGEIKGKTK